MLTAASVIWMMQNAIGNTTYNKGLTNYLLTSAHQSVGSDELYAGIQTAIDEDFATPDRIDVTAFMRTWEFQVKIKNLANKHLGIFLLDLKSVFSVRISCRQC